MIAMAGAHAPTMNLLVPINREAVMKKCAVLALSMLIAFPAAAQSLGEKTGLNSAVGISPSTADFVKQAATSDMFEIDAGNLALQRAKPAAKAFAKQMVADHTKTSNELRDIVSGGSVTVTLPTALDSSQQKALKDLNGLNGDYFSKKYLDGQVSAHKDAVSLFQRYADSGDNPALRDWAGKTLPGLQRHLDMAEKLDK